MARKQMRKIMAAAFMATVMTAVAGFSAPVYAQSLSDLKDQRAAVQAQNDELNANLDQAKQNTAEKEALQQDYESKISTVQGQIDSTNEQIRNLDAEIEQKQEEIKGPQAEIDYNMELLKQRLRAIYMAGETSTLDIILGAKDFDDFLDKASILKTVTDHDVDLIHTIQGQLDAIQEEKDLIEQNRAQVADAKKSLDSQQAELTRLLEENQALLEELYGKQQEAQDKLDENDAELAALESQISSYYSSQYPAAGGSVSGGVIGSGNFVWPCPGFYLLTSQWNEDRGSYNHGAIDIAGGGIYGTSVVAADSGTVVFSSSGGWGGGYGTYLMIDHGNGVSTLYAHMSGLAVSQGASVSAGQVIGYVGSTGDSSGPHLHFEVREYGTKVNPMNYF